MHFLVEKGVVLPSPLLLRCVVQTTADLPRNHVLTGVSSSGRGAVVEDCLVFPFLKLVEPRKNGTKL